MPLQIYDARERRLVRAADGVLSTVAWLRAPFRRRRGPSQSPRRILLLRLERIGDLLMALPAIADVRSLAPDSEIDLVVGHWNAALAEAIPAVTRVESLDAGWLARDAGGADMPALLRRARGWRPRHYDLAINFEPDIRSNLLLAAAGAGWTAGYRSGGGGALLDLALDFDPRTHTTDNARRLVSEVFGRPAMDAARPLLHVPDHAVRSAAARLSTTGRGPIVAVHTSGGRAIKQWEPARFASVASTLVRAHGATIVLTGSDADRPLSDVVKSVVPADHLVDVVGDADLLVLAALFERVDLLLTGDTGPMHLASAVGTPVVAVFGPSDPRRYAPRGASDRVIRVDLPCSPCNRIRLPPARCVGHTPDCLVAVSVDRVLEAVLSVLAESPAGRARTGTGRV
jgi:ADP-heptose:LPS heptosyltransferase